MAIKLNYKDAIAQCKSKHGEQFDYSYLKEDYVNSYSKVRIRCIKHDYVYNIRISAHKYGQNGCHKCKSEAISKGRSRSEKDVVKAFKLRHNNYYDYSLVKYTGTDKKVKIICPKHGLFEQISFDHESGRGCAKCGYDKHKGLYNKTYFERNPERKLVDGILYIVSYKKEDEEFIKIGITSYNNVEERLLSIKEYKDYNILYTHKTKLYDAFILESILHEKLSKFKYKPKIRFGGHTECFVNIDDKIKIIINKLNSIK